MFAIIVNVVGLFLLLILLVFALFSKSLLLVLLKTFAQHDTFHMIIEHIVVEYFSKIWGFRTHVHMIISFLFPFISSSIRLFA